MDPFPRFEACSFDFQTDNLESLHSFQLALVPFREDSNLHQLSEARTIFLRRRQRALERNEEGVPEKLSELKRLEKMKETLGAARSKQGDRRVDSEGELSTTEEIRLLKDENAKLKEELKELKRSTDGTKSSGSTRNAGAGPSKQVSRSWF